MGRREGRALGRGCAGRGRLYPQREEVEVWCRDSIRRKRAFKGIKRRTRLNPSLLSLIHSELLQFLLVAVGQLAQVGVAETATT